MISIRKKKINWRPQPKIQIQIKRIKCGRHYWRYKERVNISKVYLNITFLSIKSTDPVSMYPEKLAELRNYLLNLRTPTFSKQLVDYLLYTTRMRNWPAGFCSKDFVKMNKSKFEELKRKKIINQLPKVSFDWTNFLCKVGNYITFYLLSLHCTN